MSSPPAPVPERFLSRIGSVSIGVLLGAGAWGLGFAVSGVFEPFDSGLGFLVTQLVLCTGAFLAGMTGGGARLARVLAGSYVGLNLFAVGFGSSEARVWIVVGAITTLFLIALPLTAGLLGVGMRRVRAKTAGQPRR
jgi:hypothetical protein